jgi:hypothetical protein
LDDEAGVIRHTYYRDDGAGRKNKQVLWQQPGSDITGIVAKSEKIAGTFEQVLKKIRHIDKCHTYCIQHI